MPGTSKYQFVLDRFAVDSDELTNEHKKKLNELAFEIRHTIRFSRSEVWLLHLVGSASQSGADAYNEDLSKRRAKTVQQYIDKRLPGVPRKFRIVALGESSPEEKKIFENPRDRSVGVIARLTGTLPPPPPEYNVEELLKPKPAARKEFTFRVDSYVIQTIGIGIPDIPSDVHVGRIAMNFSIADGSTTTQYTFLGKGWGGGVSVWFLWATRSTVSGKPQKFSSFERLRSGDFTGNGLMSGVGSFLFGGQRTRARGLPRFDDFPMGTISRFEYPPSMPPSLPGKDSFSGEITKGFKPRVPQHPLPLPKDIF